MAPQLPGAVLAPPLNNIGPTKELIKPIFGQEAVACFSRWPYYLWFSGTLITKELCIILLWNTTRFWQLSMLPLPPQQTPMLLLMAPGPLLHQVGVLAAVRRMYCVWAYVGS